MKFQFKTVAYHGISAPTTTAWWCNNHLEIYELVSWDDYSICYGKIKNV
jgi:hypothetical protein